MKLEALKIKGRGKFQSYGNGKMCRRCKKNLATEVHHIINRGLCELLRFAKINCYEICHNCHDNDIEKCTEWTIPNIPMIRRFILNMLKRVLLKDYLMTTGLTEEEHIEDMIKEIDDDRKDEETRTQRF